MRYLLLRKKEKKFCASVVFEYNKEKEAVILSIDHNAGLIAEEEMSSNISLVIVSRLINELKQTVITEEYVAEQYRIVLTIGK